MVSRLILSGAVLLLAACSCGQSALTAKDLMLPAENFTGIKAAELRAVVNNDAQTTDERSLRLLRAAGIVSAGNFRYQLLQVATAPATVRVKVKLDLFANEAHAEENWRERHLPEALAMTTKFTAGDEAWNYQDLMAGLRVGRVIVEFRADRPGTDLAGLVRAYAAFLETRLER